MKDTKLTLLKTSARLFAQNGYASTSVRDIVKAANVNISAIKYHFGDKRALYLETLKYLLQKNRNYIFGGNTPLPTVQDIDKLSLSQVKNSLHCIIDRVLDMKFKRHNLPLERIFTYAELEDSREMLTFLLSYIDPLSQLLSRMVSRLTGLAEKSPELIILTNTIFWQVNLSECDRFILLTSLQQKTLSKEAPVFFKRMVWENIQTLLNSYQRGKRKL